jgi:hypothetical protein
MQPINSNIRFRQKSCIVLGQGSAPASTTSFWQRKSPSIVTQILLLFRKPLTPIEILYLHKRNYYTEC